MKLNEEQQRLFDEHEVLVYATIQQRFSNYRFRSSHGLEQDELEQFGLIGLVKACKTYDESKNTAFRSHAINHIIWSITTMGRQNSLNSANTETYDLLDKTSFDMEIEGADGEVNTLYDVYEVVEDGYNQVEYDDALNYILEKLPPAVAEAVEMRAQGYTLQEIAKIKGITHQAVRQRIAPREDKIRELIREAFLMNA